ncbi:hypothetical protein SDJN03_18647, partial [Cucurbita argyrosperma subsp. sororia]
MSPSLFLSFKRSAAYPGAVLNLSARALSYAFFVNLKAGQERATVQSIVMSDLPPVVSCEDLAKGLAAAPRTEEFLGHRIKGRDYLSMNMNSGMGKARMGSPIKEKIKRPLRTYKVKGASWLIRCWPFRIMLSWLKYDASDYAIVLCKERERERAANRL